MYLLQNLSGLNKELSEYDFIVLIDAIIYILEKYSMCISFLRFLLNFAIILNETHISAILNVGMLTTHTGIYYYMSQSA